MVGCKDDPFRVLNSRSLASLPPLDVERERLTPWLRALPQTASPSTSAPASYPASKRLTEHAVPAGPTIVGSNSADLIQPPIKVPSRKRKALADLEPSIPRKSARLKERSLALGETMPSSPSKKKETGNHARGGAKDGTEQHDAKVIADGIFTRGRSHGKVFATGSSDKENLDTVRSAVARFSVVDGIESTPQMMPPAPSLAPTPLGSPGKRKPSSSRPTSPTKSSSTKGSKATAIVDKKERLSLLNPPVTFHTPAYLGTLGKKIPPLVRSLWVGHLESDDEGFIPEALKARIPQQTPNKSKPKIRSSCFAKNTRYQQGDYERIWLSVMDIVRNADECRHKGYHESHWISYVVSPMLNLVSKLKRFDEDGMRVTALDIQTVAIDPSNLCSYSSDAYFRDLNQRIDCALGLGLTEEETSILQRGVYEMKNTVDSINQTSSFVNFTPLFVNIEVKRKNTEIDPLIQLAAWIAAEFEKRKIEHYGLHMPVIAIEVEGDRWGLHIVYADEDKVERDGYGLKFVGPVSMGDTSSLQGCFQILDTLCRCVEWGVGIYKAWFREEILKKYSHTEGGL